MTASNVIYLKDFSPSAPPPALGEEDPRWPATAGEELAPATGSIPARWSPRPARVLARRVARSQFAADLRDWGRLVGLLASVVVLMAAGDQLYDAITALTGGSL